ncbi:MAG TPA: hypothetical protein VFB45_19110 [Pseudolabrys sp.]|nr:hypothetical protein [Pseudolabrys sp.]
MTILSPPLALALALLLSSFAAAVASAEDAPPKPEPGTTAQIPCIAQKSEFKTDGKTPVFATTVTNKCEARLHCRISVAITNSKGMERGSVTMVLAPASRGEAASKSYRMTLKAPNGDAQVGRECKAE